MVHLLIPVPDTTDPALAPARVGFVVSKAVGGAVDRNLVKRRLRDVMRTRVTTCPTARSPSSGRSRPPAGRPTRNFVTPSTVR